MPCVLSTNILVGQHELAGPRISEVRLRTLVELLKSWHCITVYSPPCSYPLSVLEDVAEVIEDIQEGRVRTSYQLDSLREELADGLKDQLLRRAFPSEINPTISQFDVLYKGLPIAEQDRYAALKKRHTELRRAASSARRLHNRCLKRRTSERDMIWPGYGGLIGSELIREIEAAKPNFAKLDRLLTAFLMDCLYRGYNLDYLTSLFDRYLPESTGLRSGMLHVFRRLHSLLRHEYRLLFMLKGASSAVIEPGNLDVVPYDPVKLKNELPLTPQDRSTFIMQSQAGASVILSVHWVGTPDAGSAAEPRGRSFRKLSITLTSMRPFRGLNWDRRVSLPGKIATTNRIADFIPEGEANSGRTLTIMLRSTPTGRSN